MNFTIVHGFRDCDLDASDLIYNRLRQKGLSAEIITDEEFLKKNTNGNFVISVGGPKVNRITGRIQEIYSRALDVSDYDMPNFVWAYGSRGGIKSNAYHMANSCIGIFGPSGDDTYKSVQDFIQQGALLDDICKSYKSWK